MAVALVRALHGFSQNRRCWGEFGRQLQSVLRWDAVDLPGHGTQTSDRRGVDHWCRDIARSPADVLVGYSMGGRLALHLALAHPDAQRHLVLISTSPGLAIQEERDARARADAVLSERIRNETPSQFLHWWLRQEIFRPYADLENQQDLRSSDDPVGWAWSLGTYGTSAINPVWDRLGELRTPVTLIVGERDTKFLDINVRMAERIPTCDLIVIPDAGHATHLNAPDRCAQIVIEVAATLREELD